MIVFKQTLLPVGTVPARLCRQRRLERQEGKPFTGSCEPRIVMGNIRGSDPKQVKTCFGFFVFTKAPINKRIRVPAADPFAFPLFFRPFPLFFVLRGIELPAPKGYTLCCVLMGLPTSVFALGLGQTWIAIGLAIGYALSWILEAPRLRNKTSEYQNQARRLRPSGFFLFFGKSRSNTIKKPPRTAFIS